MMDGRIDSIRSAFEKNELTGSGILAYSVKYHPLSMVHSAMLHSQVLDLEIEPPHQMDVRSGYEEAILEANLDESEALISSW